MRKKISHRNKKRIARRLLSKQERKNNTSIFLSKNWIKAKEEIKVRVRNKEIGIKWAKRSKQYEK